jgi:ankyrin repeat protein
MIRYIFLMVLVMTSGCSRNREELFSAVKAGDYRSLASLNPSRRDANVRNSLGTPLLHWAVISGNTNSVVLLIDAGAKLEARDADGRTVVLKAAECGELPCARILFDAGASVDVVDDKGWGIIHYGSQSSHNQNLEDIESWLFFAQEQGLNLNQMDVRGRTALDMAFINGDKEIYRLLRRMGGLSGTDVREGKTKALTYEERVEKVSPISPASGG